LAGEIGRKELLSNKFPCGVCLRANPSNAASVHDARIFRTRDQNGSTKAKVADRGFCIADVAEVVVSPRCLYIYQPSPPPELTITRTYILVGSLMELISEIDNWQSGRSLRQRSGAGCKKNHPGGEHLDHEHKECTAKEWKRGGREPFLGRQRQDDGISTAPQLSLTFIF